jgi:hypothetical protein
MQAPVNQQFLHSITHGVDDQVHIVPRLKQFARPVFVGLTITTVHDCDALTWML